MTLPKLALMDFGRAARGVALASVIALAPAANANATEPVRTVAAQSTATQPISFVTDAGQKAFRWSIENPDGVAIAVIVGTDPGVPTERVIEVLRADFSKHGIQKTFFLCEQNDMPSTGVEYSYKGNTVGPVRLENARPEAERVAKQLLFEMQHPVLALNPAD